MELATLSEEAWRDAMISEDTEAFLSAARNYLGAIPTPYNKHALVSRLEAFLKRPDTAEAQASLLDSLDAEILGAFALAGPSPERFLQELLADGRSTWEVSSRLANLRDRLVIFRARGPKGAVLAVTPFLAPRLGREADPLAFLGCVPVSRPAPEPGVDADTVCALASILFHEDSPLRKNGLPSKRARERILALVPELALSSEDGDALGALLAGFKGAGFLSEWGGRGPTVDMDLLSCAADSWGERLPYFLAAASAALDFRPDAEVGVLEPYTRLAERARYLEAVAASLPEGLAVNREGLRRMAFLAGRTLGTVGAAQADYAVDTLLRFAFLRETADGLVRAAPRRPRKPDVGKIPVLVVEASHAVQVLPEADAAARVFAGSVARLESRGEVWSCVLDRRSVRRALDAGYGGEEIARAFEELSGRPVPQSLAYSLSGWEKEYLSVRLYSGVVLAADGPARTAAENAPALRELRGELVSEGVWLLETDDPAKIRAALEKAGLHSPRVRRSREGAPGRRSFPGAPGQGEAPAWSSALREAGPDKARHPLKAVERLRLSLDSMRLPEERRIELAERVSRRLVLTEEQLAQADIEGISLEAGALDYMGKVRVVERVLRSGGSLLEVLFRRPDGEPERLRVRPLELEKTDKGLMLRASDPEDGSVRVLAVSSLSHVKRIKTTLFGEDNECDNQ